MPERSRLSERIYRTFLFLILAMGVFCFGAIVILLLFYSHVWYPFKAGCPVSNKILLIPVMLLSAGTVVWLRRQGWQDKTFDRLVAISVPGLFLLQIFLFYQIFFESGWDANVVTEAARAIVARDTESLQDVSGWYFSHYPNNLLLTLVISLLLRINGALGLFAGDYELMSMVLVNSALSLGTAVLVYRTLVLLGTGRRAAFLGYGWTVLLLAFSPWNVIVYSDALGLLFPLAVLYLGLRRDIPPLLQWPLIAAVAYLGYQIKPTVFIVLIALVGVRLLEALYRLARGQRIVWAQVRRRGVALLLAAVTLVVIHGALNQAYRAAGLVIDENQRYSLYHFLMMGQNDVSNGGYYEGDVGFSTSFPGYEERKEADKAVALQRIQSRGLTGQLVFTARKVLSDYNDGTFAWSMEGNFYRDIKPEPSAAAGPLRDFFYSTGQYYPIFQTAVQGLWWGTLLLVLVSAAAALYDLAGKNQCSQAYLVVLVSLIGVTLYDAIFETRARYLYIYVPFYILCAVLALQRMSRRGTEPCRTKVIGPQLLSSLGCSGSRKQPGV